MAINSIFVGGERVDFTPLFAAFPRRNFLITQLGIFDGVPVPSKRVVLQDMVSSNLSLLNKPMKRHSSEHNVTFRDVDTQRMTTLAYYPRRDVFTPGDVMDKRHIGSALPLEESEALLAEEYLQKHRIAFDRTKEEMLARALFAGEAVDDNGDVISWADIYKQTPLNAEFDFTSTTVNPMDVLEDVVQAIETKAESLSSSIDRFVVFATNDFFNGFRRSPAFKELFKYEAVNDPRNPVTALGSTVNNASFDLPNSNITIVRVTDDLIVKYLPAGGAVVVPMFASGTQAYSNFYGAGSGRFDYLGTAEEFYSYGFRNLEGNEYNVVSENSAIPVNRVIGLSAKLTSAA